MKGPRDEGGMSSADHGGGKRRVSISSSTNFLFDVKFTETTGHILDIALR